MAHAETTESVALLSRTLIAENELTACWEACENLTVSPDTDPAERIPVSRAVSQLAELCRTRGQQLDHLRAHITLLELPDARDHATEEATTEIARLRKTLAAEQGKPEGAPSDRWEWWCGGWMSSGIGEAKWTAARRGFVMRQRYGVGWTYRGPGAEGKAATALEAMEALDALQ